MKRTVVGMVIMVATFSQAAKAQDDNVDTTGFWKVEYNGAEVAPLTLDHEQTYIFSGMNDTGKVAVYYFNETPCKKCQCKLVMRDDSSNVWKTIDRKGYGDNKPFIISGSELGPQIRKGRVYMYFIIRYDGWEPPIFMGALRLSKKPLFDH